MKVKIKTVDNNPNFIPKKSSENAGGMDCRIRKMEWDSENRVLKAMLGFHLQPPPNYRVTIVPRSSITKTPFVMQNSPGLGDPDYRGEYIVKLRYIGDKRGDLIQDSDKPYKLASISEYHYDRKPIFEIGDRICQIYFEKIEPVEFKEVDELDNTQRGSGGFGSTGKN